MEKRKNLKSISKAISIFAKIIKVFIIIGIISIALVGIALPFVVKNIKVVGNEIVYNSKSIISFDESDKDNVKIKIGDFDVSDESDKVALSEVKKFLDNTSSEKLVFTIGLLASSSIASLVILYIVYNHLDKLFKNIREKDTPFIEENVIHFRKMGSYMIASMIVSIVVGIIMSLMYNSDMSVISTSFNIITILALFAFAHIFEYGMQLQKDSKKQIYE